MSLTIEQIEQRFLGFMESNGHTVIDGYPVRSPTASPSGKSSVWDTDELAALTDEVAAALGVSAATLDAEGTRSLRIVADHLRAALVIAAAGVHPAAAREGYVLRKLVRRAVRHAELLRGTDDGLAASLADTHGYPAEVAAEEAARVGMTVHPDWAIRCEVLREQQGERSRH